MENTLYDYWPIIKRPKLQWPDGKRVAFWLGVNIEHYLLGTPSLSLALNTASFIPDPANHGWRDYGPRVGIWRLISLLDKYNLRASVLLNADVCAQYPEIIEAGVQRNWAWLAHGKNNSTLQGGMSLEDEREYLKGVVETIRDATGKQPKGWLGPALSETFDTPEILASLGVTYNCDWNPDDQPFPMNVKSGRMIGVPYGLEMNDVTMWIGRNFSGQDFCDMVIDNLDVLLDEGAEQGRVMCLALHPMIISQPFRHKWLDRVLATVSRRRGVWLTTSEDIADYYYEHYYETAVAEIRAYKSC